MKALFFSAMAALAIAVPAQASEFAYDVSGLQMSAMASARAGGLNWKVGDTASYTNEIGGFIKGSSVMAVVTDAGDGFWVNQDMDMGFMGKHKVEILFNKADGQVKQMKMDGKDQQIPDASKMEVVEMKESSVQVPAGSFQCIYVKLRDKESKQEQEGWVNPREVPISGTLKVLGQSQFGQVKQELTSFKKN